MNGLLIVNFETGDSTCPYWTEMRLVNSDAFGRKAFDVALTKYFNSPAADNLDMDFADYLDTVLTEFGVTWQSYEAGRKIDEVYQYII